MITEKRLKGIIIGAIVGIIFAIFYSRANPIDSKSGSFFYLKDHGQIEVKDNIFVYYPNGEFLTKEELKAVAKITADSTKIFIIHNTYVK